MGLFSPKIKVQVLIKGRIGDGWFDIDRKAKLPVGATLSDLIEKMEKMGVPMKQALRDSPHLAETLMLNGDRCPVAENSDRELADGDQVYLLAPLAGG